MGRVKRGVFRNRKREIENRDAGEGVREGERRLRERGRGVSEVGRERELEKECEEVTEQEDKGRKERIEHSQVRSRSHQFGTRPACLHWCAYEQRGD